MIVVLSGGTGGAKLIEGLAAEIDPAQLTIICNTGDDAVFHGLYVSPDIDTIIYTLAGLIDAVHGWGIKNDTFNVLEYLRRLGADTWFNLGDRDLATHITRTRFMHEGLMLSQVTERIRRVLGVKSVVLPMSDDRVETRLVTPQGEVSFQEYFVKEHWSREVTAIGFRGAEGSRPAPGVLAAIREAETIVICPSNPITSIGPILAVPGIRGELSKTAATVVGVSPLIGTTAISGPAHQLLRAAGFEASALGAARCFTGVLNAFLIADEDKHLTEAIAAANIETVCTNIRMTTLADKRRLAREVLALAKK
jgi:LPPG:FO 2-phospho-L-lactate transferase